MENQRLTQAEMTSQLEALQQRVTELESLVNKYEQERENLALLATFPAQNPNMVIETDPLGQTTYLNPMADARFPELWSQGFNHPILKDLKSIVVALQNEDKEYVAREIDVGDAVYEQKICYTKANDLVRIRIYVHDITARKRAEESIQKLAKQVVLAQEEERHRVSRELHDEAGQALTALKISLQLIQADLPLDTELLRQNLDEAVTLTDVTRERIRLLAQGLRPPALDTMGLNLTLEDFCRNFAKRTKLEITYQGKTLPSLSDAMSICLYRFIQEALTNVAKHAQAHQVEVALRCEAKEIFLSVVDDGQGFNPEELSNFAGHSAGIGLLGLQERLELLGGWLEIETDLGQGTRLVAHLPLEEA